MAHEAVQLFIERARNIQPSFVHTDSNAATIVRICRQLDGMPLAIELAAARTSLLSLSQIEARLKHRFQLLSGGHITLPRHQTLRATIEWSHDLLSEAEKILFRRLSVFAGGWTLEAAEWVTSEERRVMGQATLVTAEILDLLAGLVNKSLVAIDRRADDEVRYRMLETIREYAGEQLRAADEKERLRARHFDYFLQMAQQGEPKLFAPVSFIDWAEAEIDNLRAGLAWALERDAHDASSEERAGRALDLMLHVWPLWLNRGYSIEGNEWLNQLLSVHTAPTLARARALLLAGDFAGFRGDHSQQTSLIQEALALAQKLGDKKRIAWAWMEMGVIERGRNSPEAIEFLAESLAMFQELKENLWVCRTSYLLAEAHLAHGNREASKPLWERGVELSRKEGDKFQLAWGLEGLGNVERLEGHFERAREFYRESLKLKVAVMDKTGIFYSLSAFAQLAAAQKQFKRAVILWSSAEKLGQSLNMLLVQSNEGLYTSLISEARAELGEEAFVGAWAEGRKMKMQEAIRYALTLPGK
jgi:non-specific serine/threonine protein kinase